jgi:uncharacterized membrane-anchored protein
LAYPATKPLGLTHGMTMAILTPVIVLAVWLAMRKIRNHLD